MHWPAVTLAILLTSTAIAHAEPRAVEAPHISPAKRRLRTLRGQVQAALIKRRILKIRLDEGHERIALNLLSDVARAGKAHGTFEQGVGDHRHTRSLSAIDESRVMAVKVYRATREIPAVKVSWEDRDGGKEITEHYIAVTPRVTLAGSDALASYSVRDKAETWAFEHENGKTIRAIKLQPSDQGLISSGDRLAALKRLLERGGESLDSALLRKAGLLSKSSSNP